MPSEELSLTWDEHHNTLVGVFEKLLETSTLVDCTIAAEGQYLKAHKIILSACSPYFELLFSQENEKNPIVVLKDIKFQELRAIIDFIYSGKVKVPDDRLGDFVDAAESLQIKGLGGDNHEKVSSEKDRNESPHLQRMEVCMSPIPRKRRCPFVSTSEDSVSEIPSGSSINENKNSGNISSHPIQTSTLHCQTEQNSSIASTSSSSPILPVNVQNKQSNIQTNSPVSFAEQLDSPEEVIPRPERVVVKIEPEPMAEVFIPEIDFETKGEEEIEDPQVLDSGGRIAETGIGDMNSLHTPNQFTAFASAPSTLAARSDNVFLNVAEHSSTQGLACDPLAIYEEDPLSAVSGASPRRSNTTLLRAISNNSLRAISRRAESTAGNICIGRNLWRSTMNADQKNKTTTPIYMATHVGSRVADTASTVKDANQVRSRQRTAVVQPKVPPSSKNSANTCSREVQLDPLSAERSSTTRTPAGIRTRLMQRLISESMKKNIPTLIDVSNNWKEVIQAGSSFAESSTSEKGNRFCMIPSQSTMSVDPNRKMATPGDVLSTSKGATQAVTIGADVSSIAKKAVKVATSLQQGTQIVAYTNQKGSTAIDGASTSKATEHVGSRSVSAASIRYPIVACRKLVLPAVASEKVPKAIDSACTSKEITKVGPENVYYIPKKCVRTYSRVVQRTISEDPKKKARTDVGCASASTTVSQFESRTLEPSVIAKNPSGAYVQKPVGHTSSSLQRMERCLVKPLDSVAPPAPQSQKDPTVIDNARSPSEASPSASCVPKKQTQVLRKLLPKTASTEYQRVLVPMANGSNPPGEAIRLAFIPSETHPDIQKIIYTLSPQFRS